MRRTWSWPTRPSASARRPPARATSTSRASSPPPRSPTSQAIHPGYGFLSENAHFAEVCRECKIEFIGPPHEAMRKLGNKNEARKLARKPPRCRSCPAAKGSIADRGRGAPGRPTDRLSGADQGGGRRRRPRHARRPQRHQPARRVSSRRQQEAEAAFKDGSVYLEKYIEQPRHVEVQILGDQHGNVVHLWERDCSLQRRHQKLVEESPAPNLPAKVREEICEAAVRLARGGRLLQRRHLRVPRRQAEQLLLHRGQRPHPGRASGHRAGHRHRPGARADPHRRRREAALHAGATSCSAACAIECRINAEDPANDFRPSPGTITRWQPPGGPGVRLDTHVVRRLPRAAELRFADRQAARPSADAAPRPSPCMRRALGEFVVEGIKTTIPLHREDLQHTPRSSKARSTRPSSNACSSARARRSRGNSRDRSDR